MNEWPGVQIVRLVDVFLLGPFLVWSSKHSKGVPEWARWAMLISGILTIAYNGARFLEVRAAAEFPEKQET